MLEEEEMMGSDWGLLERGVILRGSVTSGRPLPRMGALETFQSPFLSFGVGSYTIRAKGRSLYVSIHLPSPIVTLLLKSISFI